MSMGSSEARALQDRLDIATRQLSEVQAAHSDAQRQLSQLHALPNRLDDAQDQLRSTVVRLSEADAEVVRLRAQESRLLEQLERTGEDGDNRIITCLHFLCIPFFASFRLFFVLVRFLSRSTCSPW